MGVPGVTVLANRYRLARHLADLERSSRSTTSINPFWAKIYAELSAALPPLKSPLGAFWRVDDLIGRINALWKAGYHIAPAPRARFEKAWRELVAPVEGYIASPASLPADRHEREIAMALMFLHQRGLLDPARSILGARGALPSRHIYWYMLLRHVFYARQIVDALPEHAPIDALEIGAGGGGLKLILGEMLGRRLRSYTIVDLPQMICLSAHAACRFYPEEAIGIANIDDDALPTARHVFVPADRLELLKSSSRSFNLFLNTHSFQEMDDAVIADYFDVIYDHAADKSLFFNTNWRQPKMTRLDGSLFDNDPDSYPYHPDDVVLQHGPDPFHEELKAWGLKTSLKAVTSIRRIRTPQ